MFIWKEMCLCERNHDSPKLAHYTWHFNEATVKAHYFPLNYGSNLTCHSAAKIVKQTILPA